MLRYTRKSIRLKVIVTLGFLSMFVGAPSMGHDGPAQAPGGRVDHPESYYLTVLGLCYRAGAGMFGEAVVETVSLSAPISVRQEVRTDWELAVRGGGQSVTAFCAHSYYAAVGKGYLHSR
jgi:hypothetical protein